MNKSLRILFIVIASVGVLFLIGTVTINYIIKNKIQNFIDTRLPPNILQSYKNLTVQTFDGSIILNDASVILKNKSDGVKHTFIQVEKLKISNVHYWDYLMDDEIHIESIQLENPKITYYQKLINKTKDTVRSPLVKLYKPVFIDKVEITNGRLAIYESQEKDDDSTLVFAKNLSLEINSIALNNETLSKKLPVKFEDYSASSDSIFVKVSKYENLTMRSFTIEDQNALFENVSLQTKYSRPQLSRIIPFERDHYDLVIKELGIENIDFGFMGETFFAKSSLVNLISPTLDIFRDKLVNDDTSIKPLYSKMLRELPFELTVDSLKLQNANIKYSEKVKAENSGGFIFFSEIDVLAANVSNTYNAPEKTEIKVKANFMEKTPFSADWSFDVQNTQDQFTFMADVGALVADRMNSFTEPNLRVKLEGNTNKTYFSIYGNNTASHIDMKINYSDFKISVLQKDGKSKNKILSAIANIFVSKDSRKKDDYYREGSDEATRDKTKSVFNYLWINVKNGLLKSMTGWQKSD
ncbi:AsmA family protein [Aequorivita echinoideorum]|uniref:DUF748 domain-containing protein n=1 Tax=Aequorivita echinoideorum TaxID=1549647 RepID=A0ABS5S0N5_9FLAO|nr:hypothetical protein [Aequorivita echinoideorum]MBT0606744.1 hypothetical protein [Aequorivita echinoideorum]